MILTEPEIRSLTRRERPAAQARVLRQLGVPFRTHPTDGVLLVPRGAATVALGGQPAVDAPVEFEVNLEALGGRGRKAAAKTH